jgi:hypothetical protein
VATWVNNPSCYLLRTPLVLRAFSPLPQRTTGFKPVRREFIPDESQLGLIIPAFKHKEFKSNGDGAGL